MVPSTSVTGVANQDAFLPGATEGRHLHVHLGHQWAGCIKHL